MKVTLDKTQVISSSELEKFAVILTWLFCGVLWFVSVWADYVQFVGGAERQWPVAIVPLAIAFSFQGVCTLAQASFKAKSMWVAYVLALLVSVVPSFLTFYHYGAAWMGSAFTAYITNPYINISVVGLLLLSMAVMIDLLPEWLLVEEQKHDTNS